MLQKFPKLFQKTVELPISSLRMPSRNYDINYGT